MRHKKKSRTVFLALLSLCLTLVGLILLIVFLPPDYQLSLVNLHISVLYLFFLTLALFLFFLGTILLKSKTQGVLIALFVVSYLLFRLNNFTHPFFFILLAALFLTVELLFTYKRE